MHFDAIWNWNDVYKWNTSILMHVYAFFFFYQLIVMLNLVLVRISLLQQFTVTSMKAWNKYSRYKEDWLKRRPVAGFKHIHLLHDNAPRPYLCNSYGVFEERKSKCFASPTVSPSPFRKGIRFLFVFENESIPCWAEIPVPAGSWICHSSVPYYCVQISVPWRLQEVEISTETLHF